MDSIGSHGCIKNKTERSFFQRGLEYVVNELMSQNIVVYGSATHPQFSENIKKTESVLSNSTAITQLLTQRR